MNPEESHIYDYLTRQILEARSQDDNELAEILDAIRVEWLIDHTRIFIITKPMKIVFDNPQRHGKTVKLRATQEVEITLDWP